jgi:single-stranded-DNA-specific exonuclease
MAIRNYTWEVSSSETEITNVPAIIDILLSNRGIIDKYAQKLFFEPIHPQKITVKDFSIDEHEFDKAIKRIVKAVKENELIIVYGDYDADGVCATAILWQTLYRYTKNVIPFMPDRFIDGYGLHEESVAKLKKEHPELSLIITVDNGIVANKAIDTAQQLGIDVVISDHHQKSSDLPKACAIVHTDSICGSGVSWILARGINGVFGDKDETNTELDLAAIGTIADQMPLLSFNRSFAKHGLIALNETKRLGLLALLQNSGIEKGSIGTYEVNFQIAPRINAMGRLENAMDALRLLCTTNAAKARSYAVTLGKINTERQRSR